MLFGQRQAFRRFDITKNKQHGVVGHIISLEKGLNVPEVRGIQVREIAVEIVRVGPVAKGNRWHVEPGESAVRFVHDVDADFFLYDIALIFQVFFVNL